LQKIFSISAAVFYLVLSIGVNLNFHYCEDEVKDIHLAINAEATTDDNCHTENPECCDEKEPAGCEDCCSYNQEKFKIEEDQQISSKILLPFIVSGWFYNLDLEAPCFESDFDPETENITSISKPPAYLSNCSFIFYG